MSVMTAPGLGESFLLPDRVLAEVREIARNAGIEVGGETLVLDRSAAEALAACTLAGGEWARLSQRAEWMVDTGGCPPSISYLLSDGLPHGVIDERGPQVVNRVAGVFRINVGGQSAMLVGFTVARWVEGRAPAPFTIAVLCGPALSILVEVARALGRATPRQRVLTWGNGLHHSDLPDVSEDEVILPEVLKRDLLGGLDRFWRLQERASALGLATQRGLLFAGAPGTGKTRVVRHLMSRYRHAQTHVFISDGSSGATGAFTSMLRALHRRAMPAIVVLEDIDHMVESGAVTREFLLNALDGLLAVRSPLLWLATANDPTIFERNLLDRPGRFDAVVVFPLPELAERRAMLERFSPLGIDPAAASEIAAATAGLSGAHLREMCQRATLALLDGEPDYRAQLLEALQSVRRQHDDAGRLAARLRMERVVGFGG